VDGIHRVIAGDGYARQALKRVLHISASAEVACTSIWPGRMATMRLLPQSTAWPPENISAPFDTGEDWIG
jgi:hypothetical protein